MVLASYPVDALHGWGVPNSHIQRLAASLGLPSAAPPGHATRIAVLLGEAGAAEAPALWARPFAAWIEVGPLDGAASDLAPPSPAIAAWVRRAGNADLYACLTTPTANNVHLAGRIVDAVAARHPLTQAQRDDIELALHEAISNALVHGNLQIEGMKGLSVDSLDRFSRELAARMADPTYASRRIEVSCWLEPDNELLVEVVDEGSGFAPRSGNGAAGASGRGLDLIGAIARQIELFDDGRGIRMRFAL